MQMNLNQLQAEIAKLQSSVAMLQAERKEHVRKIALIDRQLNKIMGDSFVPGDVVSEHVTAAGKERRTPGKGTLIDRIIKVIKKAESPLRSEEILPLLLKSGWHTKSHNPKVIVGMALKDNPRYFNRVERGVYTLSPTALEESNESKAKTAAKNGEAASTKAH
jgi:hypothetical protein